ncbi:hypothetical protein JKF63_05578 [Porcisia hertigi]|uniref:Uncharacterized protein n=1 Tax=Porcisia hertigi TaxID=2761500 RepID=A0A836I5T2_9TRYP|nr:hypothetical protein JKF63_05578 [Porcisia hertigi]
MKQRQGSIETHTVAARRIRKGGTETTRAHHFPLYSHPMFRAAIHNENAVQGAIAEQSGRVNPEALDAALDNMVTQLIEQQLNQHDTEGGIPPELAKVNPIVTEGQLLALLAEATGVTPTLSDPQRPSAVFQPIRPEKIPEDAAAAAPTTSPSPPQQQLPQPREFHTTLPPLRSHGDAKHRIAPSLRTGPKSPTSAAPLSSGDEPAELNVVSVNALQEAALRNGEREGAESALQLPSSAPNAECATVIDTTMRKAKLGSGRGTSVRQHPAKASLYSLLPCLGASPSLPTAPVPTTTASSFLGPPASTLSFRHMDRRPGIGVGPVAQQAVDAQQLHQVPDAVFAAMDVLMDGNSCCMRRRRRLEVTNRNKDRSLALKPIRPPGGRGDTAGSASFAFGCGSKGESLNRMYVALPQNTLPAPPLPRTAAEAKSRRILESQRRRQWLHDQKRQHLAPNSSLTGSGGTRNYDSSVTLPIEPLGWRHRSRLGSKDTESAYTTPLPLNSSGRCSSSAVPRTASTRPPSRRSSPRFTIRGITSMCAYAQAVESASLLAGSRF